MPQYSILQELPTNQPFPKDNHSVAAMCLITGSTGTGSSGLPEL